MRFLFVSTPVPAHLDWGGFLPTARLLMERGHDVLWTSADSLAPHILVAGIPFAPVAHTGWQVPGAVAESTSLNPEERQRQRQIRAFDAWLDVESVSAAVEALEPVARAFAPDLIVSEMFAAASAIVAERMGVPFAVAGWPAFAPSDVPIPPALESVRARITLLCQRSSCVGINFAPQMPALQSPLLHITWWSDRWYAGVPLLPQTRHAGGIAPDSHLPSPTLPNPDSSAPWVFITLGTTFNRDPAFFRMATQAAINMGCQPILAVGRLEPAELDALVASLPTNAIVCERVEFAATLPWCAAAIHAGGAGTTHALVLHGVPQIVVPHAGDQGFQARALARCAAGLHIPAREVSVDRLAHALALLLPDRSTYRASAAWLRDEFATLGGIPRSADLLEAAATSNAS